MGLAGSSALVTATLRCLMDFFSVSSSDIPKELMPQLILDVEVAELNIQAGLQDRVVQVYEGLVSMDFAEELMASRGHGSYREGGGSILMLAIVCIPVLLFLFIYIIN